MHLRSGYGLETPFGDCQLLIQVLVGDVIVKTVFVVIVDYRSFLLASDNKRADSNHDRNNRYDDKKYPPPAEPAFITRRVVDYGSADREREAACRNVHIAVVAERKHDFRRVVARFGRRGVKNHAVLFVYDLVCRSALFEEASARSRCAVARNARNRAVVVPRYRSRYALDCPVVAFNRPDSLVVTILRNYRRSRPDVAYVLVSSVSVIYFEIVRKLAKV